ncbi:MAG: thiol-disulfide isomerase/thioredoxin [Pseudohongiellaceae bacterium]
MANAEQPKSFFHNSMNELESTFAGEPFLLSVWSIECAPCLKELKVFSKFKKIYPDFNLVLLSADGPDLIDEAGRVLEQFNLVGTSSWVYGTDRSEQLRYSIDPTWYGEMPRSYFYDRGGQRKSRSGLLSEAALIKWITSTLNE